EPVKVDSKKVDPKEPAKVDPKEPVKVDPKDPKKVDPKEPVKVDPKDPKKVDETPAGLAWRFTANKPFYQKMKTTTDQNIKVMGIDVTQKQDQTFFFKWTPIKQTGDKWEIKQEIEGIQMTIDIAGNPVSFDSTQENPATGANTALADFFKALKGSSFTLTYNTKTMKVESVSGRDEFLKKLLTANQQLEPLLKKILNDQALMQMADPTFGVLPATPKKVEEKWESTSPLNLGPIGTYTNKYSYTYKGADKANKDLDLIEVETTITYAAPAEADPALPYKIKSSSLATKEKQPPGKILFNTKLGRVESVEIKDLALAGSLTIEIGGSSTSVTLDQKQSTTVNTTDESQLPKPKEDPKKK
ncbi:MAG: hypothetical protein K8T89_17945, partial [Planctomycetes bacterium]|nr:hypothetical protein [Planctomycetota bacterium]